MSPYICARCGKRNDGKPFAEASGDMVLTGMALPIGWYWVRRMGVQGIDSSEYCSSACLIKKLAQKKHKQAE